MFRALSAERTTFRKTGFRFRLLSREAVHGGEESQADDRNAESTEDPVRIFPPSSALERDVLLQFLFHFFGNFFNFALTCQSMHYIVFNIRYERL